MMPVPSLWSRPRITGRLNSVRGELVTLWHCGAWFVDTREGLLPWTLNDWVASQGAVPALRAFGERCEHPTRELARTCSAGVLARGVWWRSWRCSGGGVCCHFHRSHRAALMCAEERFGRADRGDVIGCVPSRPGEARAESVQMRAEAKGGRAIGR